MAVDARLDEEQLGLYESIADSVVRFEFATTIERCLEWMTSLCSGEWVFRLDGDEVASPALISALTHLIEADDVLQYWFPCRWVHPDGRRWFDEWPWWPDYSNRLVRNDARLSFAGLSHSGATADFPARYVDEPFYHLVCAVAPKREREQKVDYYAGLDQTLKAEGSDRLLRHFYLPEDYATLQPVAIPMEDLLRVEAWLHAAAASARPTAEAVRLFGRAEIDAFWAQRPIGESAYRATIEPLSGYRWLRPGDHRPFRVRVRNNGDVLWPGGHDRDPLIRLSYRWRSLEGTAVVTNGFRSPLPAPLRPGESCIAPIIIAAPDEPGDFVLELDLVHEFVRWFDCAVHVKVSVDHERPARGWGDRLRNSLAAVRPPPRVPGSPTTPADDGAEDHEASIAVADRYRWMTAGCRTPFHVRVRNESTETWPGSDRAQPIRLGYRWLPGGGADGADGLRTTFPASMEPGAEALVPMLLEVPARPGRYLLEIDVVHEFVRWFGCATRVEIEVRSRDEAAGLLLPPGAPSWLSSIDPDFFDRVTRICGLGHDEVRALLFNPGPPVQMTVPALGNQPIQVRPATSDVRVIDDTFCGRYHLPPQELGTPAMIVDLGSNIGLTMADFACLFPHARMVGVELDGESAELCRRNIAPWSDRCTVIQAAIWSEDGDVSYRRISGEAWAYRVGIEDEGGVEDEGDPIAVEAMTLDTLLDGLAPDASIDYLKVDIEGSERELLRAGGRWTERVRALKVETHEPYSVGECIRDLSRVGFSARRDETHERAVVATTP